MGLNEADAALYQAKIDGRDRVILAGSTERHGWAMLRPTAPDPVRDAEADAGVESSVVRRIGRAEVL